MPLNLLRNQVQQETKTKSRFDFGRRWPVADISVRAKGSRAKGSNPVIYDTHAELSRYVVLNPVRAEMVNGVTDWHWSIYPATVA